MLGFTAGEWKQVSIFPRNKFYTAILTLATIIIK